MSSHFLLDNTFFYCRLTNGNACKLGSFYFISETFVGTPESMLIRNFEIVNHINVCVLFDDIFYS